jgi:hypothetical protein
LLVILNLEQWLFEQDLELGDIQDGIEDWGVSSLRVMPKDVGKSPPTADPSIDCLVPCSSVRLHLLVEGPLSGWRLIVVEAVSVAAIDNHFLARLKHFVDARLGNLRVGVAGWKGTVRPHDPAHLN